MADPRPNSMLATFNSENKMADDRLDIFLSSTDYEDATSKVSLDYPISTMSLDSTTSTGQRRHSNKQTSTHFTPRVPTPKPTDTGGLPLNFVPKIQQDRTNHIEQQQPNRIFPASELDTGLSSAAVDSVLSAAEDHTPSSTLVKREETTTVKFNQIRPTYVPRTTTVITNPLLDPNFKPISRSTKNQPSEPEIQKASLFPKRNNGAGPFNLHATHPNFRLLFCFAFIMLL